MGMNVHVSKPFDADAYCRQAVERRNRLMRPQNAVKQVPVLATVQTVKRAVGRPLWRRTPIQFDAHVGLWQWHTATEKASRHTNYIKERCFELGADHKLIMGKSTVRSITGQRQLLMYEMKVKFGLSYPAIGRMFNRDHSTVICAVRRISAILGEVFPSYQSAEMRLMRNPELKARVRRSYEVERQSLTLMAQLFSLPRNVIADFAKIENWSRPNPNRVVGKPRIETKICMADVQRDFERGLSCNRIGIRHGISDRSVRRLADRNGWERSEKA